MDELRKVLCPRSVGKGASTVQGRSWAPAGMARSAAQKAAAIDRFIDLFPHERGIGIQLRAARNATFARNCKTATMSENRETFGAPALIFRPWKTPMNSIRRPATAPC